MSEGDRSEILQCTTANAAPKSAPQQLSVLEAGPTEVTVQWVPPEADADEPVAIAGCVMPFESFLTSTRQFCVVSSKY